MQKIILRRNSFSQFLVSKVQPLKTTSIISATSSEPFYAQWNLANSHDGGLETYIDYCFHSKAQKNGWAEYRIDTGVVRSVEVLNRDSITSGELKNALELKQSNWQSIWESQVEPPYVPQSLIRLA